MADLIEALEDVLRLLKQDEPGLHAWRIMLQDSICRLQEVLCSLGATPEACKKK